MQVIHGYHGLKPAGPVMDFVLRNHAHFPGGIYWLNGTSSDLLSGGMELVNTVREHIINVYWGRILVLYVSFHALHSML